MYGCMARNLEDPTGVFVANRPSLRVWENHFDQAKALSIGRSAPEWTWSVTLVRHSLAPRREPLSSRRFPRRVILFQPVARSQTGGGTGLRLARPDVPGGFHTRGVTVFGR